jgi:hypothetical protein
MMNTVREEIYHTVSLPISDYATWSVAEELTLPFAQVNGEAYRYYSPVLITRDVGALVATLAP